MGVWGRVARQGITDNMKNNYIFNSVDITKITIPKVDIVKSKKIKKKNKKLQKERQYHKRIPRKYNLYIKSKFWEVRRNRYFKDYGRKCFICSLVKFPQVHHLEYDNNFYGNEKDEMLVCLCRECHEEFHTTYQTKRTMYDEFNEFIDLKKGREQLEFI